MFADELEELVTGARKGAALDVAPLPEDDLTLSALHLVSIISASEAALAHIGAELDVRGTTVKEHGLTTATWLSREGGWAPARAKRTVRTGRSLRTMTIIDDAVADGRLRFDHATALTALRNPRVDPGLLVVQDQIIEWTHGRTFDAWQRYVARFIEDLDQDGPHDPDTELARNQLHLPQTHDGVTHLNGQLVDENGAVVTTAIKAKADELFRRHAEDHKHDPTLVMPSRATLQALALVELVREARARDIGTTQAPRPDITVVIRADQPDTAHTTNGVRLQDDTTRTLRCDPDLTAIIVDHLGVPLDLGRTERYATPAQRRALAIRDGTCVFPGCDRPPSWCDAHHTDEWDDGGPTDLHNLALLCHSTHHGYTHRTGWQMHATGDGWFYWTTPTGHTFWSQRHGHQRAGPTPTQDPHGWRSWTPDQERTPIDGDP